MHIERGLVGRYIPGRQLWPLQQQEVAAHGEGDVLRNGRVTYMFNVSIRINSE
jgi:hypothetical protein